ncbi:MAG TPA: FkbM family methyltransferase [Lacibacter sp.]|nr:FkbM family methyltransferase [Lacibacter sp.]
MKDVLLVHLINWYTQRFPFPFKGLKYFEYILRKSGLQKHSFLKKLPNGLKMKLCVGDHIEKYLLWYGYYEKKEIMTMRSLLSENSVVIDIGANIGYFSLMAAQKCNKGKIYSFEPATKNFQKLEEHLRLNKIKNVTPFQCAVSNRNEVASFFISDSHNSGMSGLKPAENFSGETEMIHCIRLDDAIETYQFQTINLVKIDTEGSELNVLNGMKQVIKQQQPLLLIEISASNQALYGNDIKDIFNMLSTYGYIAYNVIDVNVLNHVSSPGEADLLFFIPRHFNIPKEITVIQ